MAVGGLATVGASASLALLTYPQVTITCTAAGTCTAQGTSFTPSGRVQVVTYAGATALSSYSLWASAAEYECDYSRKPPCHQIGGGDFTTTLPVDDSLACGATAAGAARFTDVQTGRVVSQPVAWVGPCPVPTTTTLTIPGTVDTGWTAATNPARVTAGPTGVTSGTITIAVNGAVFCSYVAGAQTGCSLANLPAGTDQVRASFSGSSTPPYEPSSASATVTVLPTNPSVADMSTNWAGYAATGETFTSVSANWTVPVAHCGFLEESVSATWVGIDGDSNNSTGPEQIGTDSNCGTFALPGKSIYWAWWQMNQPGLKGWPHFIGGPGSGSNPVSPGDLMTATVQSTGVPGQYTMTLEDHTQGDWTYSTTQTNPAATGMTAECIEEQPAALSLKLTNFGSVNFSQCKATGSNGTATPIWDHPNNDITMTDATGTTTKAAVSPLSNDGKDFTVTWLP